MSRREDRVFVEMLPSVAMLLESLSTLSGWRRGHTSMAFSLSAGKLEAAVAAAAYARRVVVG